MNEMSYLEKLLDGVEVEWRPLGKCLVRAKGTKITASQMKILNKENAPIKIFAGGKTTAFVNFNDIPEKDINREPSIIVKSRGIIEFEFYDKPFSHKNEMWSYHSMNKLINIKYIYHYLKLNENYFLSIGRKMQMPQISISDTENFLIPIPCPNNPEKSLAIQSEIVRILDKFTALTAELTAELTARKKQYNYYRDQLLSFDKGAEKSPYLEKLLDGVVVGYVSLGQLTNIKTGQSVNKNLISNNPGIYPVINSGKNPLGFIDKWNTDNDPIGITSRGAGVGSITWQEGKYFRGNLNYSVTITSETLNIRYLYHILLIKQKDIHELCTFDGIPALNASKLKNLIIPIPCPNNPEKSLAIQSEIVRILDKFDTLTHSISEGLPHEIELRQKQYEYYRDLLFSFPRPESATVTG